MIKLICVVLCVSLAVAYADSHCTASASLSKRPGQDWTDGSGRNFSTYDISVMNTGECDLTTIRMKFELSSGALISQSWNLMSVDASNSIYSLSNFGNSLQPGATYSSAGFILQYTGSASVVVSINMTQCPSCANPTNTPTGSPTTTPTGGPTTTPTGGPTTTPTSGPTNPPTQGPTNPPTQGPTPAPPVSAETIQQLITAPSELDRLKLLSDGNFVFDFKNSQLGVTQNAGGKTVATSRTNFPAVIGHGVAMTVGFIEPCGINLPHTHPRATEINFIASGRFQAGFFLENGARFIGNVLETGMATVFPQGAIHFEINLECEPAMFVAAFNNEDPGVQTTASSFFGLPVDVVAVSLNISSIQTVEDLAKHLPSNPAVAMQECMQRCGFAK